MAARLAIPKRCTRTGSVLIAILRPVLTLNGIVTSHDFCTTPHLSSPRLIVDKYDGTRAKAVLQELPYLNETILSVTVAVME